MDESVLEIYRDMLEYGAIFGIDKCRIHLVSKVSVKSCCGQRQPLLDDNVSAAKSSKV